jgi:hypothetical protein
VKTLLAAVAAAALLAPASPRAVYPERPITMIVPFAAGGPTDTIARIVADDMSRTLGQQVVIENVAGAGGTTGITRASQAPPDGYTIMMGHMGTHGAAPAVYPNLKYDPVKDFAPIGLASGTPILIVARKDFPAKDLKEFMAYAKQNGSKLNEAHAGVGSVSFSTCTVFNSLVGVKPTRVVYRGTGPALNDRRLRAGGLHVRSDPEPRAADPGGDHQGVRGGAARALPGPAERADHEGGRPAGVPGERLERNLRAEGDAPRDHEEAQRCAPQGAQGSGHAEAHPRPRRRPVQRGRPDAGRAAQARRGEVARWSKALKGAGTAEAK